ncbi:SRPBCC family protein [Streptomyces sp. NPDC051664]|uniref:SRPBCC family protein n=1 Tax=Streptomyces sp. NPDC051664 TaxID=3365668 RepID=UPI003790ACB2
MTNFIKKQQYNVPAAEVWGLVGDFHTVETWMPGIADVVGDDAAQTRTISMHDGGKLVERLLEQGTRFHHYRFDDPGPVPVRDFTARLTVIESGPQQSAIEWTASFEPAPGVSEEDAVAAIGGFYQACLDKVAVVLSA